MAERVTGQFGLITTLVDNAGNAGADPTIGQRHALRAVQVLPSVDRRYQHV